MTNFVKDNVGGGYNRGAINENFRKLAEDVVPSLLHAEDGNNLMHQSLNMGGNPVVNAKVDTTNPKSLATVEFVTQSTEGLLDQATAYLDGIVGNGPFSTRSSRVVWIGDSNVQNGFIRQVIGSFFFIGCDDPSTPLGPCKFWIYQGPNPQISWAANGDEEGEKLSISRGGIYKIYSASGCSITVWINHEAYESLILSETSGIIEIDEEVVVNEHSGYSDSSPTTWYGILTGWRYGDPVNLGVSGERIESNLGRIEDVIFKDSYGNTLQLPPRYVFSNIGINNLDEDVSISIDNIKKTKLSVNNHNCTLVWGAPPKESPSEEEFAWISQLNSSIASQEIADGRLILCQTLSSVVDVDSTSGEAFPDYMSGVHYKPKGAHAAALAYLEAMSSSGEVSSIASFDGTTTHMFSGDTSNLLPSGFFSGSGGTISNCSGVAPDSWDCSWSGASELNCEIGIENMVSSKGVPRKSFWVSLSTEGDFLATSPVESFVPGKVCYLDCGISASGSEIKEFDVRVKITSESTPTQTIHTLYNYYESGTLVPLDPPLSGVLRTPNFFIPLDATNVDVEISIKSASEGSSTLAYFYGCGVTQVYE